MLRVLKILLVVAALVAAAVLINAVFFELPADVQEITIPIPIGEP